MKINQIPLRLHGRPVRSGPKQLGRDRFSQWWLIQLGCALAGIAFVLQCAGIKTIFAMFAGSKSDYLENLSLNLILGNVPAGWTRPGGLGTTYLGYFSVGTSDANGGTELTGNNYSRTAITNNGTNWPDATTGVKSNGTQINGPIFTGTTPTVVGWGMYDAATSGNLLYWGDLAAGDQKAYALNDQPIVPIGQLTVSED